MSNGEQRTGSVGLGLVAGILALLGPVLAASTARAMQDQESNPFALKQPTARELPSILERDAEGEVVWIEGDPARKVVEMMELSAADRRTIERLQCERDELLLNAAVPNTDKIIELLEYRREGNAMAYDAFGRRLLDSLGEFGRRGPLYFDAEVRNAISRGAHTDLNAIVREYNLARVDQERAILEAQAEEKLYSEQLLRDSTTLQRFQQLDVAADAARMLREHFGGDETLAQAHPELAETIQAEGYWPAMSKLTDAQLAAFVSGQTGQDISFPSPEAGQDGAPAQESQLGTTEPDPATDGPGQ